MVDVPSYLERIAYHGPTAPTLVTLRALHLAHLRTVPFENLDIGRGVPLGLDEAALFDKIARRRRGSFCFELNGLFAALLRDLGFRVTLLAAQYPREPGVTAPYFDHLVLLVRAADSDERWLADVGAGRTSPAYPLRLDTSDEQVQPEVGAAFRIVAEGDRRRLHRREAGGDWAPEYAFSFRPHVLADFAEGCRHHETSPASIFTRGRICSRLTENGRVTLSGSRLITTTHGARDERDLPDEAACRAALRTHFGIDLDAGPAWA
jgi:N-hydroxyarylamine O-acetyltransferase